VASKETTLFDRIGGEAGLEGVVRAFYERVLADPEIAPFFADVSMERQRNMQREFLGAALGGPVRYSGRSLVAAHQGHDIRTHHFARFVEHLLETLREQGVDEEDVYDVISRVNTYSDQITGEPDVGA